MKDENVQGVTNMFRKSAVKGGLPFQQGKMPRRVQQVANPLFCYGGIFIRRCFSILTLLPACLVILLLVESPRPTELCILEGILVLDRRTKVESCNPQPAKMNKEKHDLTPVTTAAEKDDVRRQQDETNNPMRRQHHDTESRDDDSTR